MTYGFEVLTSDGMKQITSTSDIGMRLAGAYVVNGNPSEQSTVGYAPNGDTLTPTVSGTLNGPATFDISNSGMIISFLDYAHGFFSQDLSKDTTWKGAGVFLPELSLSWDNSTKVLTYSTVRVDDGGLITRPFTGRWNIWFLYGV